MKQNYSDIPLYIIKKHLSLSLAPSKWVGYMCFFKLEKIPDPTRLPTQILLMS